MYVRISIIRALYISIYFASVILITLSIGFFVMREEHPQQPPLVMQQRLVGTSPFERLASEYQDWQERPSGVALSFQAPKVQLPKMEEHLHFHGFNGRPDADPAHQLLIFTVDGQPSVAVAPHVPVYLRTEPSAEGVTYRVASQATPLWFVAHMEGQQAQVHLFMKDVEGNVVTLPADRAAFTLPVAPAAKGTTNWALGKERVDGAILVRQGARWGGVDLFLQKHGGAEYAELATKQRITFKGAEGAYTVYLAPGEYVIWDQGRWQSASSHKNTQGYPLLWLVRQEGKALYFELFDSQGLNKQLLTLWQIQENPPPVNWEKDFVFLGGKTRSQFLFEMQGERRVLATHDWLLWTSEGWKKLDTPEKIDQYVDGQLPGALLVIDALDKEKLIGTFFGVNRSAAVPVEIPFSEKAATSGEPSSAGSTVVPPQ